MKAKTVKACTCMIRGIVEMYDLKDDILWKIHPYNYYERLRNFKFCPICGRELPAKRKA